MKGGRLLTNKNKTARNAPVSSVEEEMVGEPAVVDVLPDEELVGEIVDSLCGGLFFNQSTVFVKLDAFLVIGEGEMCPLFAWHGLLTAEGSKT